MNPSNLSGNKHNNLQKNKHNMDAISANSHLLKRDNNFDNLHRRLLSQRKNKQLQKNLTDYTSNNTIPRKGKKLYSKRKQNKMIFREANNYNFSSNFTNLNSSPGKKRT
jgi:hypothetical protein